MTLALLTFVFAAFFQNRLPDKHHRLCAILAVSNPDYWLALTSFTAIPLNLKRRES